jgi:hypothetical protein
MSGSTTPWTNAQWAANPQGPSALNPPAPGPAPVPWWTQMGGVGTYLTPTDPNAGLGALYSNVNGQIQQQQQANAPSGLVLPPTNPLPPMPSTPWTNAQWSQYPQGPTAYAAAQRAANAPATQQLTPYFDASNVDPRTLAALAYSAPALATMASLSGLHNPAAGLDQSQIGGIQGLLGAALGRGEGPGGGYGGNISAGGQNIGATGNIGAAGVTGGSTGFGGPPGGSGNAARDAAAGALETGATKEENEMEAQGQGGMY